MSFECYFMSVPKIFGFSSWNDLSCIRGPFVTGICFPEWYVTGNTLVQFLWVRMLKSPRS